MQNTEDSLPYNLTVLENSDTAGLTFRGIFSTTQCVKRIGTLTKFEMGGDSEFRVAEMDAAISKLSGYQAEPLKSV